MKDFNSLWLKLGGLLIVFYTIFFRVFRPRMSGPIKTEYSAFKYMVYLGLIVLFSLVLVVALFAYLGKARIPPGKENTLLSKLKIKFIDWFGILHRSYATMIDAIGKPFFDKYLLTSLLWPLLLAKFPYKNRLRKLVHIIFFLPPFLMSFIFCIETIIFHHYTLFPFSPLLLIIPLGARVLIYFLYLFTIEFSSQIDESIEQVPWVLTKEQQDANQVPFIWVASPRVLKDCPGLNQPMIFCIKLSNQNMQT